MKVKIKIPETLSEITLKDYQKYDKIAKENKDNPDAVNFLNMKLVEIFCKIPFQQIKDMVSVTEFDETLSLIKKAFDQKSTFRQTFKLNGVEYGFIPDLENMLMGEFVDLDTYLSNAETFHKAMSVLYRPITKKKGDLYLIEPYQGAAKYSDEMLNSPLDVVFGAQVFFYNLGSELMKSTVLSLQKELRETNPEAAKALGLVGDGTQVFMHLLKDEFLNLNMSLN